MEKKREGEGREGGWEKGRKGKTKEEKKEGRKADLHTGLGRGDWSWRKKCLLKICRWAHKGTEGLIDFQDKRCARMCHTQRWNPT
jgi:hypothetical protein